MLVKQLNRVDLILDISYSWTQFTKVQIGYIPEGFRPNTPVHVDCPQFDGILSRSQANVEILPDGAILITPSSAVASTVSAAFSYRIDY